MRWLKLFLLLSVFAISAQGKSDRPNIILFYVDDLGWKDLSCQGSLFYETPNIDRLAQDGVRFTQAYAAYPRCLPSRYGVITGCYPARSGVSEALLRPSDVTLGEALQQAGYATCFIGKWHLSGKFGEANLPKNQGFDVSIAAGAPGAPPTYFYPYRKKTKDQLGKGWELGLSHDALPDLEKNGRPGEYLTERLTDEAIAFIRKNADHPFFLYLSHYGVHTPFEAPDRLVKKYKQKLKRMTYKQPAYIPVSGTGVGEQKMRQDNPVYAAMIESVDESLGRLLELLDEMGLSKNTLIVFTSDNGGLSNRGAENGKINKRELATSNLPLRTGKGWLYEGGIREPFIVKWDGVVAPGIVNQTNVISQLDLFPTFLEVAGMPLRPECHKDGRSFLALLKGNDVSRSEPLFWHSGAGRPYSTGDTDSSAIRLGKYKLLEWYHSGHVELYDLSSDLGEQHDLSQKMPEKVMQMRALLHAWRKETGAFCPAEQCWLKKH